MKLVLVDDGISISNPAGPDPSVLLVTPPAGFSGKITAVPITDINNTVDGYPMCTKITISIDGSIGEEPYKDLIVMNGTSTKFFANELPVILLGDTGTGEAGSTSKIISTNQTSTFID